MHPPALLLVQLKRRPGTQQRCVANDKKPLGVCAAEVCVARTRHGEGVFTII